MEHLEHLRQLFSILREQRLFVNLKKCDFYVDRIIFLGYVDRIIFLDYLAVFGSAGTLILSPLILLVVMTKLCYVILLRSQITLPSSVLPFMPRMTILLGGSFGAIYMVAPLLWVLIRGLC